MAGRATYTEQDQARVYVALASNDGNVKRTARETGVPEATVRRWRDDWKRYGPPDQEAVDEALGDFAERAESVRWKALVELEKKLPGAKPSELITVVGVLDDKITRAKGLATSRTDHVHHLPSPDEVRELMQGFVQGALEAARTRQREVSELGLGEQPERKGLPAPR